jgi:sugar phosphate isomerase/epimerase
VKIGAALIPLVGWGLAKPGADANRSAHLQAIRRLVGDFGLAAVELNGDFTTLFPEIFDGAYYEQVARLQDELGFACTVHLPFLWLDGLSLAEPVRQATVECVAQVAESTKPLAIESYVLHLWGTWSSLMASVQALPDGEKRTLLDRMLDRAALTLEQIGLLVPSRKVCVENIEHFPWEAIVPLVEERDLRICLDVGHLAVEGGDPLAFLGDHREFIGEIHLHDAYPAGVKGPRGRDHLALGRGNVEYARLLDNLVEGGYDGVLILEVNTEADLRESVERVRSWM